MAVNLQTKWISDTIKYDGTQLRSLFGYLDHGVLGPSVVAFRGACDVSFAHMVDGEDLLEKSQIRGDDMVHFIFEVFDQSLWGGVLLQRLFAAIAGDVVRAQTKDHRVLTRSGDDLYLDDKKFSISIATRAVGSILIHFAVNVTNKGTPVPTLCLQDLGLEPVAFAKDCLARIQAEMNSVDAATFKVKSV